MKASFLSFTGLLLALILFSGSIGLAQQTKTPPKVKNVILMIGDGMGLAQVHGTQLMSDHKLNILTIQNMGMMTTNSSDNEVTDSGAGGTAIATGYKTRNGMIGMKPDSTAVPSMLDLLAAKGMATGVVVSCAVTHATPASFIAKEVSRNNYEAIAADYLDSPVNVVIGGGIKHFDKRKDGKKLTQEMIEKGFSYYNEIPAKVTQGLKNVLILTDSVHPAKMQEGRGNMLPDGVAYALQILDQSPEGFFLMVEGSQIDWAGHANDSAYLLAEMHDFDRAVGEALKFAASSPETLVIVTADHETGGLTFPHAAIKGKSRFSFSTGDHTGVMVPVYASGSGATSFMGQYDNTDLIQKIMALKGLNFD